MLKLILIAIILSTLLFVVNNNDSSNHFLLRTYILSILSLIFIAIIVKYVHMPVNIFMLLGSLYVIFFAIQFINSKNVYIRNIFGVLLLISLAYLAQLGLAHGYGPDNITTSILITSLIVLVLNIIVSNLSPETLYKIVQYTQWVNTFFFISFMFFAFSYGLYTNFINVIFTVLFVLSLFMRISNLYLINKTADIKEHTAISYGLTNDILFVFGNTVRLL